MAGDLELVAMLTQRDENAIAVIIRELEEEMG